MSKLPIFVKTLKSLRLDGFIVTNDVNIFYLSGFRGVSAVDREAILIFNPAPTLITAALYQAEAKRLKSKDLKVIIVRERNEIVENAKKLLKGKKRIGFEEEDLRYSEFSEFKKALPDSKLIPHDRLIEDLRLRKTEDEIAAIDKAQNISIRAFEKLRKTIKPGQTEGEIADKLNKIIKSLGGQGLAFESIVATGKNAALPHYFTGRDLPNGRQGKTKIGEVLLLDFGAKYKGYCADITRTVLVGKADSQKQNIYDLVSKAQETAIKSIVHGLKASDAYHAANNVFKKQKIDKYFIHGLGHGIGLEVHERPYLRPTIHDLLEEGMIFSIEPGLYFPAWGGVRIEDLVVIKGGKAKILGQ